MLAISEPLKDYFNRNLMHIVIYDTNKNNLKYRSKDHMKRHGNIEIESIIIKNAYNKKEHYQAHVLPM
jgi:hypothetical protein